MALKFWNVAKANAEIERLSAENESLTKKVSELESAAGENESEAVKAASQLEADLATAKQSISTLESERDKWQSKLAERDSEISSLRNSLATKDGEVEIKVSRQVATVQAALGDQKPVIPESATAAAKPELKGMERVIAGIKAAIDKDLPLPRTN